MVEIIHCNIRNLGDAHFYRLLEDYPEQMRRDIDRYIRMVDKKSRLASREIVKYYFTQKGHTVKLEEWALGTNKKPFLPGLTPFNISHSGDMVVVAFSEEAVGIDVEQEGDIDMNAIVHYFHKEEIDFFHSSSNKAKAFFSIWTRKEAFLKATGIGLLRGLDQLSILNDVLEYEEAQWFLQKVDQWPGYPSAICTPKPVAPPRIEEYLFKKF